MAIPDLDNDGLLPPGVYDCTMPEIRERFGRFNGSDQREKLFQKLERFVEESRRSGVVDSLIVNGSFTTAKPEPSDVDLVVVLPASHDFAADLSPNAYNNVSRKRVAKRYGFDILVAAEGSGNHLIYLDLYQSLKDRKDRKKGILRIRP